MSPRGKKRLAEAEPATQSVRARLEAEEGRDDSDEDSLGTEDVGGGDTEAGPDIAATPVDIIEESKSNLSSDLDKSLEIDGWVAGPMGIYVGMIGADFELIFNGVTSIRCHKFMLAARSEVFRDMFMANPKLDHFKTGYMEVETEEAAKNMVRFIYTGTIDDVPIDSVSDHFKLAATFKLEMIGQLLQKKLCDSLNDSNCVKLLGVAISHPQLQELREKATNTVVNNLSVSNCVKLLIVADSHPRLQELREKAINTVVKNLSFLTGTDKWAELSKTLTDEIIRTYFIRK